MSVKDFILVRLLMAMAKKFHSGRLNVFMAHDQRTVTFAIN